MTTRNVYIMVNMPLNIIVIGCMTMLIVFEININIDERFNYVVTTLYGH